jgi:hypothetical protein
MLIVAHVAAALTSRLSAAAEQYGGALTFVTGWNDLSGYIRQRPLGAIVVDPAVSGVTALAPVRGILRQAPGVPVIVYSRASPEVALAIPGLVRSGIRHVILHPSDDTPQRLARILRRTVNETIAGRLVALVDEQLRQLPVHVATPLRDMLERPGAYASASALLRTVGEPSIVVRRLLRSVGLPSAMQLLVIARVAGAVAWMRDPAMLIRDISANVGYRKEHVLARYTMQLLGRQPHGFRGGWDRADDAEIMTRLVARMRS